MMSDRKHIYVVVAIIVFFGLVASLVAGAVAGGIAGYLVGRDQARKAAQAEVEAALSLLGDLGRMPQGQRPQPEEPLPPTSPPATMLAGGALLLEVTPDSPADKAGLQRGDIILAVDDQELAQEQDLAQVIGQRRPGDTVSLRVFRMGEDLTLDATLGSHPDDPARPYLGVTYRTLATLPQRPR